MDIKGAGLLLGGLTAGLLIGRLPLWGEAIGPSAVPRAEASAPAQPVSPDPTPRASAAVPDVNADPSTDEGADDASTDTVTLYGPDGEYPCDPACIADMADGFLGGRLSEDEMSMIYGATEPIARVIAEDRGHRRRFLTMLAGMSYDWEDPGSTAEQVAVSLATTYGLPDDFAADIQRVMEGSSDVAMRSLGLTVAQMREDSAEGTRAIERALMRERDPQALSIVLGSAMGLQEPLSASALSAVRSMADGHADPKVRGTAYYALIYGAEPSERARGALIERGLADPEPMIRMAALSAATDGGMGEEALSESDVARYREMAQAVANDAGADPELRMHALSLLSWGQLAKQEDGSGAFGPFDY